MICDFLANVLQGLETPDLQDQNADLFTHVNDEGLFHGINEVKDLNLRLNTETTSWKFLVS